MHVLAELLLVLLKTYEKNLLFFLWMMKSVFPTEQSALHVFSNVFTCMVGNSASQLQVQWWKVQVMPRALPVVSTVLACCIMSVHTCSFSKSFVFLKGRYAFFLAARSQYCWNVLNGSSLVMPPWKKNALFFVLGNKVVEEAFSKQELCVICSPITLQEAHCVKCMYMYVYIYVFFLVDLTKNTDLGR